MSVPLTPVFKSPISLENKKVEEASWEGMVTNILDAKNVFF